MLRKVAGVLLAALVLASPAYAQRLGHVKGLDVAIGDPTVDGSPCVIVHRLSGDQTFCYNGTSGQWELTGGLQASFFEATCGADGENKLEICDNAATPADITSGRSGIQTVAGIPYLTSPALGALLPIHIEGLLSYEFGNGTANNVDLKWHLPAPEPTAHMIESLRLLALQNMVISQADCGDVASATTVTLPAQCYSINPTGTANVNTINWFGGASCNSTSKNEELLVLCKTGAGNAAVFKDNTGNMQLNGDFTCAAGAALLMSCDGGSLREIARQPTAGGGGGGSDNWSALLADAPVTGQNFVVGSSSTISPGAGHVVSDEATSTFTNADTSAWLFISNSTGFGSPYSFAWRPQTGVSTAGHTQWQDQSHNSLMTLDNAGALTVKNGVIVPSPGTYIGDGSTLSNLQPSTLMSGTFQAGVAMLVAGSLGTTGSGSITANAVANNAVPLGTGTTGDYVSGVTASQGLLKAGTEGATLGLIACTDGQILKNVSGTSWACAADAGGAQNMFTTITPSSGGSIAPDSTTDTATYTGTAPIVITGTTGTDDITWSAPTVVVGPGSATDNGVPTYSGTTGKIIADSGCTIVSGVETCSSGYDSPSRTTEPGNRLQVYLNSTAFTNDPTCANSGTAGRWTMIDSDETSGVTLDLCNGTSLAWRAPATDTTTTHFLAATATAGAAAFRALADGDLPSQTSAQVAAHVSDETGTGALVLATSPTLVTPALGTPASGVLTNTTGLPISSGVSGLGTGVATALATPSSANIATAVTDETGSGALVFATSPTFVTPILGTPTSGTLTNATGLPISTGVSGLGTGVATALATPSSVNIATAVTDETGSGALVFATSPTFVTPILGTPTSGTLTNATGLPISTGVSGLGTGVATFLATPSSANAAAMFTGETGTGNPVFDTSPTIVTPTIASFTNAPHNHTNAAGGGLLTDASQGWTTVYLASNATSAVTTLADLGIAFTLTHATNYEVQCLMHYTQNATTTGSYWSFNGGQTPVSIVWETFSTGASSGGSFKSGNGLNGGATSTDSLSGENIARIFLYVSSHATNDDTAFTMRFASEVAVASGLVVEGTGNNSGSYCKYRTTF